MSKIFIYSFVDYFSLFWRLIIVKIKDIDLLIIKGEREQSITCI